MQKKRVMTCLVAGVCILAVSVTAAFGSVNGYANYKTAVKSLALDVDNVSARGTFQFSYDGSQIISGELEYAKDGPNNANHSRIMEGDRPAAESWNTTLDGVNTWFDQGSEFYYQYEYDNSGNQGSGLLGITADDEMSRRVVTFLEMGADTVMGDLKNNVIEVGSENGDVTYQLDIANDQVPSVVNAGLSLMAYAISDSATHTRTVEWEDYNQLAIDYYEQQTGEALPDEFKDAYGEPQDESWWEDNQEILARFDEVTAPLWDQYYEKLEKEVEKAGLDGGVLYVRTDGSSTFYNDVYAFRASGVKGQEADMSDMEAFIGQDMTLKNVHFTFSINKAGQLTANHCTADFDTVDQNGGRHTLTFQADVSLKDYGTTVIRPLDVGGRTLFEN